jgi:signal peptidase I
MAPTILGRHFLGKCPKCGAATIVSVDEDWETRRPAPADRSICTQCYYSGKPQEVNREVQMGDRILVRKFARPKRWDLVVFPVPNDPQAPRPPGSPAPIYVKRLVGLPGETIEIKSGEIWINGAKQTLPEPIAGLRWELPEDNILRPRFATNGPFTLGPGDCFTLGDNSANSYDSRFWGPVPAADLRGVASLVYFPPRAWRTLPRH